jgi:hypothetical protein
MAHGACPSMKLEARNRTIGLGLLTRPSWTMKTTTPRLILHDKYTTRCVYVCGHHSCWSGNQRSKVRARKQCREIFHFHWFEASATRAGYLNISELLDLEASKQPSGGNGSVGETCPGCASATMPAWSQPRARIPSAMATARCNGA